MIERRLGSRAALLREPRSLCTVALIAGGVTLGYAIHIRDGEYIGSALVCVAVAFVCAIAAVVPHRFNSRAGGERSVLAALTVAYLFQFVQLLRAPASGWNEWSDDLKGVSNGHLRLYYAGVCVAGVLAGVSLLDRPRLRRICIPLLLAVHAAMGFWMIRHAQRPFIDVYHFQQEASAALREGKNPYAMAMPDIYAGTEKEKDRAVYGQGLSSSGRLSFGFPYTPLSLYLAFTGWLTMGDHRYAQLAAMTLAGALVAYLRPGSVRGSPSRTTAAAGAMLLFTPRAFFILGRGWTEPFVVCGLAATVFAAVWSQVLMNKDDHPQSPSPGTPAEGRQGAKFVDADTSLAAPSPALPRNTGRGGKWRQCLPIFLGLFLATKQYLIFVAPAIYLLTPPPFTWRRFILFFLQAVAVAAVVTAPLALWDVRAFFHSIWTVQKIAPFREDALSFLVWIYHLTGIKLGVGIAFTATAVASLFAVLRCPRTPAGFAAALALIYLPMIALNKQAFANYYYFVIGAFWCAVAANEPKPDVPL